MSKRALFIFCNLFCFQFLTSVLDTQIHAPLNVRYYPDHQPPLLPFSVRPHLVSSILIRIHPKYRRNVLKNGTKTGCSGSSIPVTRCFFLFFLVAA